ncbi:oligosaccharide flippase family protein [Shewanella aegiceratis]|uniref:oligosaccharide flippase family protein n=1 Tax=Shewanella aegiceratis TaxID=2864203 RepID=UPI001C65C200|nr:oligosaccharide flippase family protein [Shewanella aegiceratis]QYJ83772.1 oligosaccharide flippase family protein [Shewanella aegiceratis]
MNNITHLFIRLSEQRLANALFWLGSAQILGRIVRLGASIIIARLLTPEVFGEVAIILTCFELLVTPTRRISSAALIKMDSSDYIASLGSANRLNWLACLSALTIMCLLSLPLSLYYHKPGLIAPMLLMASSYLLLPFGMLYAAQNLKHNRMRIVGRAVLWQTLFDGTLTALLALFGLGIWAIIVPKVLAVLVWIWVHRQDNPLPYHRGIKTSSLPAGMTTPQMARFGVQIGLSDLLLFLRQNIDYLLIGYLLGVEALGIYFFAFNASLGISMGLIQSYGTALYSHLCAGENKATHYLKSLKLIAGISLPIITLQALLAPWYLPLVYGQQWIDAGALPIFLLLCLSGLTRPLGEAASQLLIALGKSRFNLISNGVFTALLMLAILLASPWGLVGIATAVLALHLIVLPLFSFYLYLSLPAFAPSSPSLQGESL